MGKYNVGDELSIRLLGYPTPLQVIARVDGEVSYALAEKHGSVSELYYNLKSTLSDAVIEARTEKTFLLLSILNPLATSLSVGQEVYACDDLYDANLTTLSKEKEEFVLRISISHDVVGGNITTMDEVESQLTSLLDSNSSVVYSLRSNGLVADEVETGDDLEQIKEIVAALVNVPVDKLAQLADIDIGKLSEQLASLIDAANRSAIGIN